MDKKLKANINLLLDYMWEDEKRHYEENPNPHHIFEIMLAIREEINDADNLYGNDILDPNDPDDYELLFNMKKLGIKFRVLDFQYILTSIKFGWLPDTDKTIRPFLRYRVDDGNSMMEINDE